MLEFSVSNQLLSRLDATKVVADSENYLECAFRFSRDWDGTAAVATFGHSKVKDPISVRIVDGKCRVPHEVIRTYGFQLAVYGTAGDDAGAVCRIPTNVVTVEVESSGAGQGVTPAAPTKSLYDSLMATLAAEEAAATQAKVSALASAQAAQEAQVGAQTARTGAEQAAQNAATSAVASAKDALITRVVCEDAMPAAKKMEAMLRQVHSYALEGEADMLVSSVKGIQWQDGAAQTDCMFLDPGKRYRVRVNETWYDVPAQWVLVEECRDKESSQAELTGVSTRTRIDTETPEVPGGDEVNPGGELPEGPTDPGDIGGNTGGNTGGGTTGGGTTGGDTTGGSTTGGGTTGGGTTGGGTTGGTTGGGTTGGTTGGGSSGGDETPEVPGGDEVIPGGNDDQPGSTPVTKPTLRHERMKDIVRLEAGPVTVEDVILNKITGEIQVCWLRSTDLTVREVEVRTAGPGSARYYYEQAMAAAARAEAAAARAEARPVGA